MIPGTLQLYIGQVKTKLSPEGCLVRLCQWLAMCANLSNMQVDFFRCLQGDKDSLATTSRYIYFWTTLVGSRAETGIHSGDEGKKGIGCS